MRRTVTALNRQVFELKQQLRQHSHAKSIVDKQFSQWNKQFEVRASLIHLVNVYSFVCILQ